MKVLEEKILIFLILTLITNCKIVLSYRIEISESAKNEKEKESLDNVLNIQSKNIFIVKTDKKMTGISEEIIFNKNHILHRSKRSTTYLSTKWQKTNLTYRLVLRHNSKFLREQHNILKVLHKAFNVWQKGTVLKFKEIKSGTADIMIYFEEPKHPDIDQIANKSPFGFAFGPGEGIWGDIYFNEDRHWNFTISHNTKHEENISFLMIALHMIGHSLGLGPSQDHSSIMYERVFQDFTTLPKDDLDAINHIYGTPEHMKQKGSFKNQKNNNIETPEKKDIKDNRPKDYVDNGTELEKDKEENVPNTGFSINKSYNSIGIFLLCIIYFHFF